MNRAIPGTSSLSQYSSMTGSTYNCFRSEILLHRNEVSLTELGRTREFPEHRPGPLCQRFHENAVDCFDAVEKEIK